LRWVALSLGGSMGLTNAVAVSQLVGSSTAYSKYIGRLVSVFDIRFWGMDRNRRNSRGRFKFF